MRSRNKIRSSISAECLVRKKAMVEKVEIWDIERLIPSARNARTHSDAQVAEIAGSIAAFGFMVPIVVDSQGLSLRPWSGSGCSEAKTRKGTRCCYRPSHGARKRAYAIADNKLL